MAPRYISSPADLITSRSAVCEGFLLQARTKTQKANPYVQKAKQLWLALQTVEDINKILNRPEFRDSLIAAAGFSQKARSRLSEAEINTAVHQVFSEITQEAQKTNSNPREEILYRYLLTMGEALGGEMRNLTGAEAGAKLTVALLNALRSGNVQIRTSPAGKIQRISWSRRLILFDTKPRLLDKNIDVILLNTAYDFREKELLANHSSYLACGELKGGIDPAGADEHWKTAKSALDRIRDRFSASEHSPNLFFIGAAIEPVMAEEIFVDLQNGRLRGCLKSWGGSKKALSV